MPGKLQRRNVLCRNFFDDHISGVTCDNAADSNIVAFVAYCQLVNKRLLELFIATAAKLLAKPDNR